MINIIIPNMDLDSEYNVNISSLYQSCDPGEKSMVQDALAALSWLRREAGFEARLVVRLQLRSYLDILDFKFPLRCGVTVWELQ